MKKHFVSLVAFVSLLALASCSETSSTTPSSSNSTVENSTTSAEENSTTTSMTTDSTTTSTTDTTDTTTTSDSTVTDVEVTEIKLSSSKLTLEIGESETLAATVLPENATDKSVSWTSDDEEIATVDSNGKVTAIAEGETVITVTSKNGKTATCDVTVNASAPDYVEMGKLGLFQVTRGEALYFTGEMDGFYFGTTTDFSAAVDVYAYDAGEGKLNLRIGEDGQYIAAKKSDDGEHENIVMQADPFAWGYDEAHDAFVATLSDGDYYIGNYSNYDTLSLSSTKYIDTAGNNIAHIVQEEIPAPALESITISGSETVEIGSTITLKATPNLGAELVDVVWTSSDTDVATVENGVVTGLTEGTTQITAKSGEITSDPFEVTVVAEIPSADTLGGTIDFTGITGNMSDAGSIGEALVFEAQNESGLTFVSSSGETNMFAATGSNTKDGIPGIKFGTGSKDGSVTLTFSGAQIGKVVLTGLYTWNGKTVSITVNDVTQDATFSATGSLEFVLASPTMEITLTGSGSERRFILGGMELYTI